MKIGPLGAEFFHEDGQTDLTKLTVAFRNFAKVPKNERNPQIGSAIYPIWDVMVLPP